MLMTMPAADSDKSLGFDFMGVEKTIIISGVATGVLADLQALRVKLDNLCTGEQVGDQLSCDFYSTINVFVQEVETHLEEGAPYTKLNYRLQLVEGKQ